MKTTTKPPRVILVQVPGREPEIFGSLAPFFRAHPGELSHRSSIEAALSRRREPYVREDIKIQRLELQR